MPNKHNVTLRHVSREDVVQLRSWLEDDEVAESWFGRYSYGDPAHLGYQPDEVLEKPDSEWDKTFDDPEHRIFSIYDEAGEHIGELHVAIEEALGDGQISILIGRKDKWHQGYGRATVEACLKLCFEEWGLYRVWVDVPEYNTAAKVLFEHLGFQHEGTLRQSRPHEGSRYDSVVMGMLAAEFQTRPHQQEKAAK